MRPRNRRHRPGEAREDSRYLSLRACPSRIAASSWAAMALRLGDPYIARGHPSRYGPRALRGLGPPERRALAYRPRPRPLWPSEKAPEEIQVQPLVADDAAEAPPQYLFLGCGAPPPRSCASRAGGGVTVAGRVSVFVKYLRRVAKHGVGVDGLDYVVVHPRLLGLRLGVGEGVGRPWLLSASRRNRESALISLVAS